LGHASRLIPIIERLAIENTVIIAADNAPLKLLQQNFPKLESVKFSSIHIKYPENNSMMFSMMLQTPKILKSINKEHEELDGIVKNEKIDIVISDNRYGAWNNNTYNIFITHQLMLKMPKYFRILEELVHKKILSYIDNFDECWIPDFEGNENYTGDLSHKYPLLPNAKFIGILSRFSINKNEQKEYDICIVLSGPEPQRTILENIIISQVENIDKKIALVRGLYNHQKLIEISNDITVFQNLNSTGLSNIIQKSELIICRAGYSSIMDLVKLEKKAVLIPTPGQTEQEYLAKYLNSKKQFEFKSQDQFNLADVIS